MQQPWASARRILIAALASVSLTVVPVAVPAAHAADESWSLSGSGWGHGVGMSQYGAREMAADGKDAKEILAHYYPGTTFDAVPDTATIAVNLRAGVTSSTMVTSALASGGGKVTVAAGDMTMTGDAASLRATPQSDGTGVAVTCGTCTPVTSMTGPSATISWDDDKTLISVDGTRYKDGRITISRAATGTAIHVVAQTRIHDEYLDYIAEVPWSWPAAALEAQAAAARAYALVAYARGVQQNCSCHVYNTTASQVFGGYPPADRLSSWDNWRAAVRATGTETSGYVPRHGGAVIEATYYSSSGGRTQNNEDVWVGDPQPYLRSVADPWSLRAGNPFATWTASVGATNLATAFRLPDVARLDLSSRFTSGAVDRAVATASDGRVSTVDGRTLAARVGLRSSYISRHGSRLGGSDRYATAARVAAAVPDGASAVVIAGGEQRSLVAATVGGPLAGVVGAPILLTRVGELPGETATELDRRAGALKTAYVLGGEGAVSSVVVNQLQGRGLTVVRLGGASRYETSQLVAEEIARHRSVTAVVVAEGRALSDVVSASGPSAALGHPILLTTATTLHPAAAASLAGLGPDRAYLAGGWIKGAAESAIKTAVPAVTRLSGADRYATSAALARAFAPRMGDYRTAVISSGLDVNLVDSISAGALQKPMILVRPTALPSAAQAGLQQLPGAGRIIAIGGTGVVSDAVLLAARRS